MSSAPLHLYALCFALHKPQILTTASEKHIQLANYVQYTVAGMLFTHPLQTYAGRGPVKNFYFNSKMSHNIRIPLVSQRSRLQLQTALNRLRDDQITRALPHTAWRSLDCLSISLGELRLRSPKEIAAASSLLRKIGTTFREENKESEPLCVTLRGLSSGGVSGQEQRAHTSRLYWSHSDSAALGRLRRNVRAAFKSRSFLVQDMRPTEQVFDESFGRVSTIKIMSTHSLTSDEPNRKPTLARLNLKRIPVFDATDLYAQYGDTVWAENIPLEKLCLTDLFLKDLVKEDIIIGQGYADVSSVLLPGVPESALEVDPDIEYVRAAKSYLQNRIVTPLVIPSNSQPLEGRQDFEPGDRKAHVANLNSIRINSWPRV